MMRPHYLEIGHSQDAIGFIEGEFGRAVESFRIGNTRLPSL